MRKILFVVAFLAMAVMQVSANSPKDKLKEMVEEVNGVCPIDLGMLGVISSTQIEGNMVVMTIELSDQFPADFEQLELHKEQMKASMLSGMASSEGTGKLFGVIADAGAGFVIRMARSAKGKHIDYICSNAEVKKLASGEIQALTPRERLEDMAENTNVQCPQRVDEMTVMTKVAVEGNYMVYYYDVDENQVNMSQIEAAKEKSKAEILRALKTDDPIMNKLRDLCRKSNIGIKYIYCGYTTRKQVAVTVESREM